MLCLVGCGLLVVKRVSEGIELEGAGKSCLLSLVWVVGCRPENLGGNLMALQSYRTGIYDARAVFFGPITPIFCGRSLQPKGFDRVFGQLACVWLQHGLLIAAD